MIFTFFVACLATLWAATVLTAFCPRRALRRRRQLAEIKLELLDSGQGKQAGEQLK